MYELKNKYTKGLARRSTTEGFTFVEMLVAITILVLAVVGPLYLSAQGLRAARIARDQIQANYMAQEVIEYVRWIRDNNALNRESWLNGLSACMGVFCGVDVSQERIVSCEEGCVMYFNESTGLYKYDASAEETEWNRTKFTRTAIIDNTTGPDREALVTVTVTWQDGLINRTHVLSEYIYNWNQ